MAASTSSKISNTRCSRVSSTTDRTSGVRCRRTTSPPAARAAFSATTNTDRPLESTNRTPERSITSFDRPDWISSFSSWRTAAVVAALMVPGKERTSTGPRAEREIVMVPFTVATPPSGVKGAP